jgi:hypothetical protein
LPHPPPPPSIFCTLDETEEDTNPSASDQGGHDDRQPNRRASANDFGTSIWTTQEWKILLASSDINDSDDTSEDDGKPRTYTKPSKCKTKWSASQAHSQVRSSLRMLSGRKKAEPFRALRLPDTINWLEPELMKPSRARSCEPMLLGRVVCPHLLVRRRPALMPAGPYTMCKTLPPMANASQEELNALKR